MTYLGRILRAVNNNRRMILLILASVVVALITYSLIIPASTLEKDKAKEQGGIDIGETSQELTYKDDDFLVKCALSDTDKEDVKDTDKSSARSLDAEEKAEGSSSEALYDESENDLDLRVKELTKKDKEYKDYTKKAEDAVSEALSEDESNQKIIASSVYDITLMKSGEEAEPDGAASVTFEYNRNKQMSGADDVRIVHFAVKNGKEQIELIDQEDVDIEKKGDAIKTVNFKAESFSVYAIVYTVDFHYAVNGKQYDYSIEGGSSIGLSDLLPKLGVVSENDIEMFMSEVEKVEFSDEDLIKVIKDDNSDDWTLKSLSPFDTDETLTITMKNGDVFVINVTDAQDPSIYIGKKVIIYDNNEQLAMTSNWEENEYRTQFNSIPVFEAKRNNAAHWTVENHNDNYYLKSSDNRYLTIDGTNVGLVNNWSVATPLGIQAGSNPDYRIYDANNYNTVLTYEPNGDYSGLFCAPGGTYSGEQGTNRWLYIEVVGTATDPAGDWMLYFDDDFSEITVHVGETITLRPYNKWEWKEGNVDVQTAHWNVGAWSDWSISSSDNNGAKQDTKTNGCFEWTRYVKKDDQLITHYWSLQGRATSVGDYILTNTKNNKTITVHVVDGDPVNVPPTITNTADIKVNLFDYDKYFKLDPSGNTNLANNNNNKNDSTNKMGGNNHFYFLSSGSGNNNNESWNSYTKDSANPGIVKNQLDDDGYPVLTAKGTSLKYLFDTSKTSWTGGADPNDPDGMIAYPDVNGMFQKDSDGYYYYNSNTNYFYYDKDTGKTYLYEHTYTHTSSADKNSLVNDKPIGFFPFHPYDSTDDLYVNQNSNLNHHVGMSMDIDFFLPSNRKDENGKEIEFDFSGDDDLWVFVEWIDDNGKKQSKMLLDLGGIHQPVTGKINFSDNSTGLEAGKNYTLKVFYLERGGCDSNCSIRFNLPIVKDLTVAKKLNGLTPTERQKYFDDPFLYELAFKEDSQGINMDLSDEDAVWANKDEWRSQFQLYNTSVKNKTDEVRNYTVFHSKDGDIKGYPVEDGHITLKNGESFTVKNLPRTDIFYLAEENQLDMQQFEDPHAERLFHDDADNKDHEEEVHLHRDTAASDNKPDWETKPYALKDTENLVYTNTLQEKNLDVIKEWSDGNDNHTSDTVTFQLKATVDDGSENGVPYDQYMTQYNQTHNTSYSTNINAQWTEMTEGGIITHTENVLNKEYSLKTANDWLISFEHLPKKTQDPSGSGYEIKYSVEEVVPTGSHVQYDGPKDTDTEYLDLFKFWPDDNSSHDGSSDEKKAEHIQTYVKRNDGMYLVAERGANGEYKYTGVTSNLSQATQFLLTAKSQLENSTSYHVDMNTSDQYEMFDYACRINGVPKAAPKEEGQEGDPAAYTYSIDERNDEDRTTTGLVMFERPVKEIKMLNTPDVPDSRKHLITGPDIRKYVEKLADNDNYDLTLTAKSTPLVPGHKLDIMFIVDTTWSMTYAMNGTQNESYKRWNSITGSIADITSYLAGQSIDCRYSMVRFSDSGQPYGAASTVSGWTGSAAEINSSLAGLRDSLGGGTNYESAFYEVNRNNDELLGAARQDAEKLIFFISDGEPNCYYDQNGITVGDTPEYLTEEGYWYYPTAVEHAQSEITKMTGYDGFYAVGVGNQVGYKTLDEIVSASTGDKKGAFICNDSQSVYNALLSSLTEVSPVTDVTITDTLSDYAEPAESEKAKLKITVVKENGEEIKEERLLSAGNTLTLTLPKTEKNEEAVLTATYDTIAKQITLDFPDDYELEKDWDYRVTMTIEPTLKAYEEKRTGDYDSTGVADTGTTSAGQRGFRTNAEAKLTYTGGEKEYPDPVIQLRTTDIRIRKTDESKTHGLSGARFTLYRKAVTDDAEESQMTVNEVEGLIKVAELTSGNNGIIQTGQLIPGTYYLEENEAPAGYSPYSGFITFSATIDDYESMDTWKLSVKSHSGDKKGAEFTYVSADKMYLLTIPNDSGVELPSAGGPGIHWIYMLGALLALGCGIMLISRARTYAKQ